MTRFLDWLFRRRTSAADPARVPLNPVLIALHMDQASNRSAMR